MKKNIHKIAILTPSISRLGGGMFFSVRNLSRHLIERGITLKVFSAADEYSQKDLMVWDGIPIELYNTKLGKLMYSGHILNKIYNFNPDTVYLNGIWTYQSILSLKISFKGIKTIIAPRGMVDGWALTKSSFQKRIALATYEKYNFRNAHYIHALCHEEAESVWKKFPGARIKIIPNGISVPFNKKYYAIKDGKKNISFTLGYIGRVDEKKGLHDLLLALSHLKQKQQIHNIRLIIAGWGNINYSNKLKEMVDNLMINDIVDFIGQIYGEEKEKFYSNIDAFILPSYSEGLPMAILDSWIRSIPVLMTDECNLQYSFKENAAIRITHDPKDISAKILNLFNKKELERRLIGERGFLIAKQRYAWENIVEQFIEMLFVTDINIK